MFRALSALSVKQMKTDFQLFIESFVNGERVCICVCVCGILNLDLWWNPTFE